MVDSVIGVQTDPALSDVLFQLKRDLSLSINCCLVGTIQSYSAAKNTAKVSINFQREMNTGEVLNYPVLDDCPVFILSGGNSFVSCPIVAGDECLVLFNDRNIDNWWVTGLTSVPADTRAHSIADGIVLVGINSLGNVVATPANSVCVNGGSKKVSIKNASTDLKTLMDTLIDDINSLIDLVKGLTVIDAGTPTVPSGIWPIDTTTISNLTTLKTTMTTYKTTLATLLDTGAT